MRGYKESIGYMTLNELMQLKNTNIEKIDRCTLVDITGVKIDVSKPAAERMINYLDQIKNPYCFLCDGTPVKICFGSQDIDLGKKLKDYYLRIFKNDAVDYTEKEMI